MREKGECGHRQQNEPGPGFDGRGLVDFGERFKPGTCQSCGLVFRNVGGADDGAECFAEAAGHDAFDAGAHTDVIDLGDGDDLGGRAGEEDLIGTLDLFGCHVLDVAGDVKFRAQVHDEAARDAFENTRIAGWREDLAVLDDEDVVAGALADVTIDVEHDGLIAADINGLDLGQDVVEVVEAFDARVKAGDWGSGTLGDDDAHALLVFLFRVELDLIGDADDAGDGALAWVQAQSAVAAGNQQADVAFNDSVGLDAVTQNLHHCLAGKWDFHVDGLGGAPQTLHVLAALEDLALVDADALKDAVAVKQAVVVHADHGLVLRHHAAVDVDDGEFFFGRCVREGIEGSVRTDEAAGGCAWRCLCRDLGGWLGGGLGGGLAGGFDERFLEHLGLSLRGDLGCCFGVGL